MMVKIIVLTSSANPLLSIVVFVACCHFHGHVVRSANQVAFVVHRQAERVS